MTQQLETSMNRSDQDLANARRVFDLEAKALNALAAALDASFVAALDLLQDVKGRVIVTGMGKSGHVARKIAATLASTGTPALYVHPGEASHGDLGMITRDDGVLALSNSGNTTELGDVVAFCRRFGIPLIGITARRDSSLAGDANLALILPRSEEACPMGLAPTTSTTMMLALGDALAIALLERKGFSVQDFHLLHPGGTLGARLLRVGDVMRGPDELPLCALDTPMADAILVMTEHNFGCVGVLDEDKRLAGVITDGDLRRHMAPDLLQRRAGDVMTLEPQTIDAQLLAAEAVGRMNMHGKGITSLFVVESNKPIGIVRMHDCLRAGVA